MTLPSSQVVWWHPTEESRHRAAKVYRFGAKIEGEGGRHPGEGSRPAFDLGPWVGARVGPHRCPILRPVRIEYSTRKHVCDGQNPPINSGEEASRKSRVLLVEVEFVSFTA